MRRVLLAIVTAMLLSGAALAQTFTETVLYSFGSTSVGSAPGSGLIQASDGNFYGVLEGFGSIGNGGVYRITPSGTFSVVYEFTGGVDGASPALPLIEGPDGALYGTTSAGGGPLQLGGVFRLTLDGVLTPLYQFSGYDSGGYGPAFQLTLGSDGWLYGTLFGGGDTADGLVFKISTDGKYVPLQIFYPTNEVGGEGNYAYGGTPGSPVVEWTPGNFVGLTSDGGTGPYPGEGTTYAVSSEGSLAVLNHFGLAIGIPEPGTPYPTDYVEAFDGNLYSVDCNGGAGGTLFNVTPDGSLSLVANLKAEEDIPLGIMLGSDGLLYASGLYGGLNGTGSFFSATTGGTLKVLYSFGDDASTGGREPVAPMQGSDGNFYVPTAAGGSVDAGAIVKLTANPALLAPVQVSLSASEVAVETPVTVSWKALNAVSVTAQQCYGFVQGRQAGAGGFTGRQIGVYAEDVYSGSTTVTPTATGTFTYALTCGGVESGFATLKVTGKNAPAATSTSLASSAPYLFSTGSAKLTATVASSAGIPTGKVIFYVNGAVLAKAALSKGVATVSGAAANYPAGTYNITAKYQGNGNYIASESDPVQLVLLSRQVPVGFFVYDTSSDEFAAGPATVDAEVVSVYDTSAATGTASFYAAGKYIGTGQAVASNGFSYITGSIDLTGFKAGTYPLTATYSGDATHAAAASAVPTPLYVNVHPTETWMEITPPTVVQPANITLRATVVDYWDSLIPTSGMVTFYLNGVAAGGVGVNGQGIATITVPSSEAPTGVYTVYAEYEGNASFGGSVSGVQNVGVK